tara:strand:+ start:5438 stop:6460 length:1023 start_codon:yes stop_codon:yes gene_type:complete
MDDYIEESVKFRMGKWYNKKFKLNEFDWNDIQEKNYITRVNLRWKFWIERFKNLGITKNPGIILDSQDAFIYDDFIEKKGNYGWSLENISKIPVATHNRQAKCRNSILVPLRQPTLSKIKNKFVDSYSFSEKKNEIVWRGKFTGTLHDEHCAWWKLDGDSYKKLLRYKAVSLWSKKFNIKFSEKFLALLDPDYLMNDFYPIKGKNKNVVKNFYSHAKKNNMFGGYLDFREEMCQYKYILNLDGHDSSSGIIHSLRSNSLMISPTPKWHIVVNFKLEPWVHYVPLKDDTSDLGEKLKWCNSNQEKCEEIVKNASEYISQFNEKSEQEIETRIFEKLYENGE